ncbi:TIGR04325 family methyltransferase [Alkalinema pantanalense CENA528]|uniref:TIGR04325 family methyltransferase n=1 Tax=Alkalinema pantanalense TaxID=1620705 RepID=UPI003D6FCE8F
MTVGSVPGQPRVRYSHRRPFSVKAALTTLVSKLPIVADYYAYHRVFPRTANAYRGVFASFAEATQAIPPTMQAGYNHASLHGVDQAQTLTLEDLNTFQPIDYPVLVWLREALGNSTTVFDLGGNLGQGYYAYRRFLSYPVGLQWQVCDVPEKVKVGQELIQRIPSPGLSYTSRFAAADGQDILLTCGTLQYLELSLAEIVRPLAVKPRHLIINHVPFYSGAQYITLQNLWGSYAPYKIQNDGEFVADLAALGYQLVDRWRIDRTCTIPFHPDRFVAAYHGFYFRQVTAV